MNVQVEGLTVTVPDMSMAEDPRWEERSTPRTLAELREAEMEALYDRAFYEYQCGKIGEKQTELGTLERQLRARINALQGVLRLAREQIEGFVGREVDAGNRNEHR